MLFTSSDTKRTLMHLFLFTNSAQIELVVVKNAKYYYADFLDFYCKCFWKNSRFNRILMDAVWNFNKNQNSKKEAASLDC